MYDEYVVLITFSGTRSWAACATAMQQPRQSSQADGQPPLFHTQRNPYSNNSPTILQQFFNNSPTLPLTCCRVDGLAGVVSGELRRGGRLEIKYCNQWLWEINHLKVRLSAYFAFLQRPYEVTQTHLHLSIFTALPIPRSVNRISYGIRRFYLNHHSNSFIRSRDSYKSIRG